MTPSTQTIAQELVKGCKIDLGCEYIEYGISHLRTTKFEDGSNWSKCGGSCKRLIPKQFGGSDCCKIIHYCSSCKPQASIYARALNEELDWCRTSIRECNKSFGSRGQSKKLGGISKIYTDILKQRISFIESELKILKNGGLI